MIDLKNYAETNCGIAIDIGTSTVKAYLTKKETPLQNQNFSIEKNIINEIEEKNAQYLYGDNVISRVMYAHYSGVEKLQEAITFQIASLIKRLNPQEEPFPIVITGNSVMLSILEGLSLESFEKSPFKSPSLFGYYAKIPKLSKKQPIYLPPAFSAFLGSDILCAGLYADYFIKKQSSKMESQFPFLVVDIGTNGEILLWKENGIIGTSCAAGPAFEGKNLSRKITGSMAIKYLSNMISDETIDKTGLILHQNSKSPLNQEDIRQLQLAKAAIRGGIETLISETKLNINEIKTCFICGNFGNALEEKDLLKIGLLPKELVGKIQYLGNAAGYGACLFLENINREYQQDFIEYAKKIATQTKILELGGNPLFNKNYLSNIDF